ncbi:MAG: cytochrome ubiquinol oxidase subunit I, partial [Nitrospirales bacterium]
MPAFGIQLEPIHFPLVGNSLVVGVFSLLHIALAGLSVGFMLLAPVFELRGLNRPFETDLAHAMTRFTVVVFSASSVLAVIMVELLIGLFPVTTMWVWNQFRGPLAIGMTAFVVQLLTLYPYYHYWDAIRRCHARLHIALGAVAAFGMLVWVIVLDGMGSYMLTSAEGASTWANVLNPTWLPLVVHRLIGDFVMAGYATAAYAGWRLGRRQDQPEHGYYRYLLKAGWTIGLVSLVLQPFSGLLYAEFIQQSAPAAYEQLVRGPYKGLIYVQFTLIGLLFLGNYGLAKHLQSASTSWHWMDGAMVAGVLLMVGSVGHTGLRRTFLYLLVALTIGALISLRCFGQSQFTGVVRPSVRHLSIGLGVLSVLIYLTMGTIRETARRPDTVRGSNRI